MEPCTIPKLSFNTLAMGARQLVVQDALEMMVSDAFKTLLLTPNTTVASTSAPGAEIMTFLAPAAKVGKGIYSEELLQIIDHCLNLDYMKRPQSVFSLQKALLKGAMPVIAPKRSLAKKIKDVLNKPL